MKTVKYLVTCVGEQVALMVGALFDKFHVALVNTTAQLHAVRSTLS